jgi:Uma2 family endonuclease
MIPIYAPPPDCDDPSFPRSQRGTPVWELAHLFPRQGDWTEREYLALEVEQRIEFVDGCLVFLPSGTRSHQQLLQFLGIELEHFVRARRLGRAFFGGYPVRTIDVVYRLPDVFYVERGRWHCEEFVYGADLCVEILSGSVRDRQRDLFEKRAEYAAAGIPEYWIVDPETRTIAVLTLAGTEAEYRLHGEFRPDDTATSVLLDGFSVNVAECFAAAE